jgi:hypothetical protein
MALTKNSLGKLGIWTFQLDMQPMKEAQKVAAQIEELGFGAVWVPADQVAAFSGVDAGLIDPEGGGGGGEGDGVEP